jgi:hypothetical protein
MAILAGAVSEMSFDTDAAAYITAVETADAASLPTHIKNAINDFVVGAKADGFWSAIKAACFLAGPATLNGALVPLVGPAPTNAGGLFVAGDYNQLTGLKGNGSTKYLDINRNNNADPQNNAHQSVFLTGTIGSGQVGAHIGAGGGSDSGATHLLSDRTSNNFVVWRNRSSSFFTNSPGTQIGFIGHTRSQSTDYVTRSSGTNTARVNTSSTPFNANVFVFARNASGLSFPSSARLAWYSVGETLGLALLDARLTTYMTAIATPTIFPRRRRSRSGGGVL